MSKIKPLLRNSTMNLHIEVNPTPVKLIKIKKGRLKRPFFLLINSETNNTNHHKFCSENLLDAKCIPHPSIH